MVADWSGDRYPARRGNALQTCRHVDTITKNILSLHNDVAHVNAHAKFDALILRRPGVLFSDTTLQLGAAGNGVKNTGKLHQHPVASQFTNPSLMLANLGINEIVPQAVSGGE